MKAAISSKAPAPSQSQSLRGSFSLQLPVACLESSVPTGCWVDVWRRVVSSIEGPVAMKPGNRRAQPMQNMAVSRLLVLQASQTMVTVQGLGKMNASRL
ncbi:hypothetical protein WKW79_02375 [Variovorax robiniae]|uniref:Uncharacterized protein n=1 Tax=Variovorax robiniae TaxID=1836199 RepID=A0ABU8X0S6_9BURK